MMREAESHAEEDRNRREEAEVRNAGDSLVYQTEKFIADNAEKFAEGELATKKVEVEAALVDLKKVLEGNDSAAIKAETEKVSAISQTLGAAMYAATAAETPKADDGVEDAEIVEEA